MRPTEEIFASIKDFLRPRDVMGIRSFFGLVEQVAWAFSKMEEMAPFRPLLSPKAQYCWTDDMEEAFIRAKIQIVDKVRKGIATFNMKKFRFCQQEVEFVGFMLSNLGVRPTEEMLTSIKDFPRPRDITGIRSFFGLVEQVAWLFSKTE